MKWDAEHIRKHAEKFDRAILKKPKNFITENGRNGGKNDLKNTR